jgi:exosortase/archaeosortase family protein
LTLDRAVAIVGGVSVSEAVLGPARAGVGGFRRWLDEVTPQERAAARQARIVAIFIGIVVVAYHYSFSTLLRTLKTDTPLAYLGLVPFMALALAAVRARPLKPEPDIHDREVDYIVGVPLLLASLAINLLLPVRLSTMFWVWRVDLLALPLFVAGAIAVLFGVRTLWRLRFPIIFLLFAWPLPYTKLLMAQLQNFTNATLAGVNTVLGMVNIATQAPSGDGSLFNIVHAGKTFQVSVASACSGVNGLVGYTLVTAAFLSIVKGRWFRKLAWLVTGLVAIWVLNVFRILLIFWVGKQYGEAVAIDALHPYLGLVTFSLGVLLMLLVMRRFGLEVNLPAPRPRRARAAVVAGVDTTGAPDPEPPVKPPRSPVPKTRFAVTLVVAFGLLSGVANASLRSFDLVSDSLGAPRLESFLVHPDHPMGWTVRQIAQYDWAKPFFGDNSKWLRYQFAYDGRSPTQFKTTATVIADVIDTDDLSTFSAYGIEACYNFHGYDLKSTNTVDLGGVVAHVITYHNTSISSDWTNVYWHWPVKTASGTRYERVNLMIIQSAKVSFTAPVPSASVARSLGIRIEDALTGGSSGGSTLNKTKAFLAAFAADLVRHQQPVSTKTSPQTQIPVSTTAPKAVQPGVTTPAAGGPSLLSR